MNQIYSTKVTAEQIVSYQNISIMVVFRAQNQIHCEVFHTETQAKFKACSRSDGGTESCAMTVGNCWTVLVCDMLDRVGVCDLFLGLAALLLLAARQTAAESMDSKNTWLCKH